MHLYPSGKAQFCIEVSDNGIGISPEMQGRIFDKFRRVQKTLKTPGSGLGLYLVKWIAMLHGGQATLVTSSEAGSTFRLCLPTRAGRR